MYAKAEHMLNHWGANEVSSLVGAKINLVVDSDVLTAVVNGADTAAYSPEQIANATSAVTILNSVALVAFNTINGYLAERYSLPLTQSQVDDSPLVDIALKLAKPEIMLSTTDREIDDRKLAYNQLRDIAKGNMTIGGQTPVSEVNASQIKVQRLATSSITDGFGR